MKVGATIMHLPPDCETHREVRPESDPLRWAGVQGVLAAIGQPRRHGRTCSIPADRAAHQPAMQACLGRAWLFAALRREWPKDGERNPRALELIFDLAVPGRKRFHVIA